jgi:peptidoglycan/LPS O-acetylase OafA/YrhL
MNQSIPADRTHLPESRSGEKRHTPDTAPAFAATTGSALLDAVRALAALLVCVEHWRNLLFLDFDQLAVKTLPVRALYVLAAGGHQAVVLFFVLSGYLVGGSVLRSNSRGTWSWSDYATRRMVRLWIVLLPALAAGALWDFSGLRLHLAPGLYGGLVPNHTIGNLAETLTLPAFFGNIAFLQTIVVAPFGSNGALWSLANEFWYYVLFPLAVCAVRKRTRPLYRVVYAVVALAVAILVGKDIMEAFPFWLLGALLYALPRPVVSAPLRWLAAVAYSGFFFVMCMASRGRIHIPLGTGLAGDSVLAVATVLFLWVLLGARDKAPHRFDISLARATARFSYSLYLAHTPFLVFMTALLAHDSRWQVDARHLLLAGGILAAAVSYSWLLGFCTEFRTDEVREWIASRLFRAAPARESHQVA